MTLPDPVLLGIQQFNRREFFECHETIEAVWIEEEGAIRDLYQGVIQIAVACHHILHGNHRGASNVIVRGRHKLEDSLSLDCGIDIAGLIAQAERCEAELECLGPGKLSEFDPALFPTIQLLK